MKPVTLQRLSVLAAAVSLTLIWASPSWAFLEDLCVSQDHKIRTCIEPNEVCKIKPGPNSVCPVQFQQSLAMVFRNAPGRSMVDADATYFLAQALGYRADFAYWIAAYNEVADQTRYAPIDQCGNQATAVNSGKNFITLRFNGFQRTNVKLDGPLIARSSVGPKITAHSGPKILDNSQTEVTYEELGNWLKDGKRTSGTLWKDPASTSVPEQIVRFGLYTHTLQDTASHSPCADDAPGATGTSDQGTYMAFENGGVRLHFGATCATVAHLAGHIQETATGDAPLLLRDIPP